jgi:hypothetical protein
MVHLVGYFDSRITMHGFMNVRSVEILFRLSEGTLYVTLLQILLCLRGEMLINCYRYERFDTVKGTAMQKT